LRPHVAHHPTHTTIGTKIHDTRYADKPEAESSAGHFLLYPSALARVLVYGVVGEFMTPHKGHAYIEARETFGMEG